MKLIWNSQNAIQAAKIILSVAVILATIGYGCRTLGIRWNSTTSVPTGLYRVVSNDVDTGLIAFCPTGRASDDSITRHYRPRGMQCPDEYAPILKPIAARPGDTVTVTGKGIAVNGLLLPNTKQFQVDSKNRPMNPWPLGTYNVAPGTLWVISTYNKYSFDSRYYGPIQISQVIAHVKPLWTEK